MQGFNHLSFSNFPSKLSLPILVILLSILSSNTVHGQEIIVHTYTVSASEDGDPKFDADGVKNGTVVWKSGAVHVLNGSYLVEGEYSTELNGYKEASLIVQPGAIIKVAASVTVDNSGKIVSVTPAMNLSWIQSIEASSITLDNVTITAIDDDEVGGDTDGKPGTPALPWGKIRMSGNDKDVLQNCTIKYCSKLGHFGSIKIDNNHFIEFGGMGDSWDGNALWEVVLNAVPVITRNKFEFSSSGGLDLSGMSPIVSGNEFKGGSTPIAVGTRLLHELYPEDPAGPISGRTEITNNTIENCTMFGIVVSDNSTGHMDVLLRKTPPFNVSIRNNKLINQGKATGIIVRLSNSGEVLYNNVDNFNRAIRVSRDERYKSLVDYEANRLRINYNTFRNFTKYPADIDMDSTTYQNWGRGIMIDAQHNFWGDPSGPEDKSDKDGLYNPYGKGMRIGNGIDYRNFIGASAEIIPDAIKISASANPSEVLPPTDQLIPDVNYTFTVNVDDYRLISSERGEINVMIKDDCGMILNGSGTVVNVTNGSTSIAIPAIDLKIPALANQILVEAALAPSKDNATVVYSNTIAFTVKQIQSSFKITGITDASTGKTPNLVQDSKTTVKFDIQYTLGGTGSGKLELDLKERTTGAGTVLQDFPQTTVDLPPGINQKTSKEIELNLPVRETPPILPTEIYYQVTMKDAGGKASGRQAGVLPIRVLSNSARVKIAIPRTMENLRPGAGFSYRNYYLTGEQPIIMLACYYRIDKQNVSNWQIQAGPLDFYDKSGKLLYSYQPTEQAHWTGLTSTNGAMMETPARALLPPAGTLPVPKGAVKAILSVSLIDPDRNLKVFTESSYQIDVKDASQTVEMDIAQGSSQISFGQIPIQLDIKNSTASGKVTAHEFQEQFSTVQTKYGSITRKNSLSITDAGWLRSEFIPLNRYWSVYDSLQEGSYTARVSITYDPSKDFPSTPDIVEDSLVIASVNPNNKQLEALPSALDKANHRITSDYVKFYNLYIVASKTSSVTDVQRIKTTADHFRLDQNYPNPFNPATTIRYAIARAAHVILDVFDVLGRKISTIVNKDQIAGEYQVQFNASSLPSGVYIYSLHAGGFRVSRKLLVIK